MILANHTKTRKAFMTTDSLGTFARFLTSGLILNLIGLFLFSVLLNLDVNGQNAALISSLILLPFAFLANSKIVFRDNSKGLQAKQRFMVTYSLVVACNYFYLSIVLRVFRSHEFIAQLSFLIGMVVVSFLVQKLWVFQSDSKQ